MTTKSPDFHDGVSMIRRVLRMWPAWIISMALMVVIYIVAPQQIGLIAYKALFLTLGAVIGYWVHVWSLGHIKDDISRDNQQHAAYRRTAFVVGSMIAFALAA